MTIWRRILKGKTRVVLWGAVTMATIATTALALFNYLYVPPPIKQDRDGYKTIRIFIDASNGYKYGLPLIKQSLENIVAYKNSNCSEKLRIQYVERQAHMAIFAPDLPATSYSVHHAKCTSRWRYHYTHPFSQKIIFQAAETTSFWFNQIVHNFNDYGLLLLETGLAIGPQYSCYDVRYAYLPYYVLLMNDLLNDYPTLAHTQQILNELQAIRAQNLSRAKHTQFCAFIYSYNDLAGLRTSCFTACNKISKVSALGAFLHNDNTLWQAKGNDRAKDQWHKTKMAALVNYKFSISIENVNVPGYITEKLLDSLIAGCIPIYAGSENRPAPRVFNQNAILFWNYDGYNDDTLERIKQLNSTPDSYQKFIDQPIFLPTAAEYITRILIDFHEKLWGVLAATLKQFEST